MHAAVDFTPQQAGRFEHPEVLGDGREGHLEGLGQLRDFRLAFSQTD